MTFDALAAILLIPAMSAAILALMPDYRFTAALNVIAALLTFLTALSLFVVEISIAFSILIAFIVIGIFLFRIRERFDTVDVQALDRFRGERR